MPEPALPLELPQFPAASSSWSVEESNPSTDLESDAEGDEQPEFPEFGDICTFK